MQKRSFPVGEGSKRLEDSGGGGLKNFRTGGYRFGQGVTFVGGRGQYFITCHDDLHAMMP